MSAFGLQDVVVAALALAALAWLTRRWWRRRKRGTCTCDGCPVAERGGAVATTEAPPASGLVSIEGFGPRH